MKWNRLQIKWHHRREPGRPCRPTDMKRKMELKWNHRREDNMSGYCAFASMDKAELRELSRKGGIASGAARREHRRQLNERLMKNEEYTEIVKLIHNGCKLMNQMRGDMIC